MPVSVEGCNHIQNREKKILKKHKTQKSFPYPIPEADPKPKRHKLFSSLAFLWVAVSELKSELKDQKNT